MNESKDLTAFNTQLSHPSAVKPVRFRTRHPLTQLFFNHVDAWQVALIVATLALIIHQAISGRTLTLLLAIAVGYWFGFALNDYWDAPYDAQDAGKIGRNFFVSHQPRRGILLGVTTAVLLLILLVFAQFGTAGLLGFAVSVFVMWAYSAPPLRLKDRAGFDLLLHATFVQTYPYALVLLLIHARWTRLDGALLAILALASLTAQVEQQARDFEVDRQYGRNFTSTIGFKNAVWLLRGLTAVLILVALGFVLSGTMPWYILPFGVIGLPAMLHRFWRRSHKPRSEKLVVLSTTTGLLYTTCIFVYFLIAQS